MSLRDGYLISVLTTAAAAPLLPSPPNKQTHNQQSSLEDVEEHLQPFLEAGPKEITAQVRGVLNTHAERQMHPTALHLLGGGGHKAVTSSGSSVFCVLLNTPYTLVFTCASTQTVKPHHTQLTPLERLKTHLALAQAAVVLYSLDRQLGAAKLTGHPIEKELVSWLYAWLLS